MDRAINTIYREIFIHENIHVLNIHVNLSNILAKIFAKVEITICMYHQISDYSLCVPLYYATQTDKCCQISAVSYPLQLR